MKIIPIETGSGGNLYLIKTAKNNKYLLECGIKDKLIMKYLYNHNEYINEYEGCFISHLHSDHSVACKWVNKYMPIYSNRQVIENLGLKGSVLKPNQLRIFKDFEVMPFNIEHGNAENYGYMFKDNESKILFMTD